MATETTLTNFTINYLTQAQFDALTTKEANEFYLTPDSSITQITAGDGLSGGGTSGTINLSHSNSVSAQGTQGFYPITFDAQGHITSAGTAITPLTEHYTTHLYVGTSSGSANAATSNGNTYLMVLDNTTVRDRRKISGTQNVSVSSNSSGEITITGPDLTPYLTSHQTYSSFTGNPTANAAPGFGGTVTISQISQSTTGQVSGTNRTITIPSTIATNTAVGLVKPWYNHTAASTGPTAGSNSTAVAVNGISTTAGRYYAVEADSNGRLFVNVPWTNVNSAYLTSHNTYTISNSGSGNAVTSISLSGTTFTVSKGSTFLTGITKSDVTTALGTGSGTTKFLREDGSWATPAYTTNTDTKLQVAEVTSATQYYPLVGTGTTAATRQYDTTGFKYKGTTGTTSAVGSAILELGNSTASGTAGNKQAQLIMYGTNARKATITLAAPSADIALALPTSGGTLALTSQIPTVSYPVTSVNSKTGAVSLTASDVDALSSSTTYVSTITTSAGAHTTISSKSGAVSFNVPTKTSHLTNDSNFVTSSGVTSISTSSPISGGTITGTGTISHATSGVGSTINTAGFYKFKYDTYGHVTGVSSVTASDITELVTIPTDENVKSTTVTAATTNYIVGSTSSSTTTGGLSKHASAVLYTTADTATSGYTQLRLGNTTVTTTAGGREGQIRLYGTTATYYVDLKAGAPSANRTITFPNATGTVALTSDLSSFVTSSGVTSITPGNGLIYGTSGSSQTAITSTGTISMATISRTNNTSTASPAHGGTFTAVDSITTDSYGRVTAVNTKTVTLPASGNTDVSVTSTTVTAASTIYLAGSSSSSTATGGLNKHGSANLYVTADSGTSGSTRLLLGNSTASGTAGAKYGYIRLYGTTAYYTDLQAGGVTANRTITFPDKGGTVALTSDIPSIPTVPTITLNGSSTTSPSFYAPTSAGTSGYYLKSSGSGAPTWAAFPSDSDTKNTAGSTDTSSKIYLIGATSQAANPQTYSHDTAYVGTDGCLYSGGSKVLTAHQTAVTSITTSAGAHSTKSSATGAVSFNVPTKTSHLTNDSGFITSSAVPTTNSILELIYPVGSIYVSTVNSSPGDLFAFGNWEKIEGQFLLGANSTWTAGSTGGSVESVVPYHNHTTTTTGTHKHTISSRYVTNALASGSAKDQYTGSSTYSGTSTAMAQILTADGGHSHTISYAGDSSNTETNMPPYLAVYMWKRTA